MTRRERLERKVEKRREWAEGRRTKAAGEFRRGDPYRGDVAFNTQPGHIPERARVLAAHDRGCAHLDMAKHHEQRADGLERQLEGSIYSDDSDAVEQLEAKAAAIDAECEKMKAENAAFRKGPAAYAAFLGITAEQEATKRARIMEGFSWARVPFAPYELTNRRANARRCRERINEVKRRAEDQAAAEAAPGGVIVKRHTPAWEGAATYCSVQFAEKPDREILNALRAAGFRWSGGQWFGDAAKLPEGIETTPRT